MRMRFSHRGVQYFFVTLVMEGRAAVLSSLEGLEDTRDGGDPRTPAGGRRGPWPRLTAMGEVVQLCLRAVHQVCEAAAVLDYVIMPDHCHFLLRVNYDQQPGFSPLWFCHALMSACEAGWAGMEGGDAAAGCGAKPRPLGELAEAVALLEAELRRSREEAAQLQHGEEAVTMAQRTGARPPHPCATPHPCGQPRWAREVYVELSFDARQLRAIRRYIRLNPARALWKKAHADRFVRFANIGHAVLPRTRQWDGMGDLTLLGSPFLFHVRLTMKKTAEEHAEAIAEILEKAQRGWIPVSGFLSEGERAVLRQLRAMEGVRYVKMLPYALPPRYDPSALDSGELAGGKMLLLSGFPQSVAPQGGVLRANCLEMNALGAAICEAAQEGRLPTSKGRGARPPCHPAPPRSTVMLGG